jgi:hypothetical protein
MLSANLPQTLSTPVITVSGTTMTWTSVTNANMYRLYVDDIFAQDAVKILLNYGFNELGLNKIWTEIYEFDSMKIEFLQKNGFKKDGQLRENYFYDGKWWDSFIFSLLRKDNLQ